jgi:hypothetical protein
MGEGPAVDRGSPLAALLTALGINPVRRRVGVHDIGPVGPLRMDNARADRQHCSAECRVRAQPVVQGRIRGQERDGTARGLPQVAPGGLADQLTKFPDRRFSGHAPQIVENAVRPRLFGPLARHDGKYVVHLEWPLHVTTTRLWISSSS